MSTYWIERYKKQGRRTVGNSAFTDKEFKESTEKITKLIDLKLSQFIIGKSILEIGCGYGRVSKILCRWGRKVCGIDIVPWAINEAKSYCSNATFLSYDGKVIPYLDQSFEIVLTWTVLQHINPNNIHKMIHEIKRVLKPGGYIIIYENVSTGKSNGSYIWFRDQMKYIKMLRPLIVNSWEIIKGFDGNDEDHVLMVLRSCE